MSVASGEDLPVDPGACEGPIELGSTAPCRGACPVGTDAAAYVALVAEGRIAEAYDVARAPNPFPSICGRVCAAPCERACRRGVLDGPVAIRALKRVLAEAHGIEAGIASRWSRAVGSVPPASRPSVAIVGAGPAGLSAAHDLRLAGHAVTLLEREALPGGMLVHGIPHFRLPRELIAQEIAALVALGATLRTGCEVGRDVSIESLLDEHAAVLVTVGCRQGRLLETPGAGLVGVIRAVDFLRRANRETSGGSDPVAGPVVVIGGGSVAFDAARSAWRLQGARDGDGQAMIDAARTALRAGVDARSAATAVTLVAPEARAQLPVPTEELDEAEAEGVLVRDRVGVLRIVGEARVEGVEVSPVRSLFDEAGRFSPQLDETRSEILPARSVVLAIGQQADTTFLEGVEDIEATPWGGLAVDGWGRTTHPQLFAAGDVATGPRDLIDAIAAGQRAAAAIVDALADGDVRRDLPARAITPPPGVASAPPLREAKRFWSGYDVRDRITLPTRPTAERAVGAEVEGVLSREAAASEASRCLRCDEHLQLAPQRCIACALCADVCPEACLAFEAAGSRVALVFDDSTCIRCGLCVERCPTHALDFALAPADHDARGMRPAAARDQGIATATLQATSTEADR